jgi:hypothetical protein
LPVLEVWLVVMAPALEVVGLLGSLLRAILRQLSTQRLVLQLQILPAIQLHRELLLANLMERRSHLKVVVEVAAAQIQRAIKREAEDLES